MSIAAINDCITGKDCEVIHPLYSRDCLASYCKIATVATAATVATRDRLTCTNQFQSPRSLTKTCLNECLSGCWTSLPKHHISYTVHHGWCFRFNCKQYGTVLLFAKSSPESLRLGSDEDPDLVGHPQLSICQ